jgi:hypothetical protein
MSSTACWDQTTPVLLGMVSDMKYLYRYDAINYGDNIELVLNKYLIVKSTPCGYWIYKNSFHAYTGSGTELFDRLKKLKLLRWVSASTKKAYAYTKSEVALVSYYHRKRKYIQILTAQLEYAKHSLNLTTDIPVILKSKSGLPGHNVSVTPNFC